MSRVGWLLVSIVAVCLGCTELQPGDQRREEPDANASVDASMGDGGVDAAVLDDAGLDEDAGLDGGVPDAGGDAGRDGGGDTARDAGRDDASVDGGVPSLQVHDVAVGVRHACAVVGPSRAVACWGHTANGATGVDPSAAPPTVPPTLLGGLQDATSICAGNEFTCISRQGVSGRAIACWGANDAGQLAGGSAGASTHVPQARAMDAARVSCGVAHACATLSSGDVRCWGLNEEHQVSSASPAIVGPTLVLAASGGSSVALGPVDAVVTGAGHTCATVSGGSRNLWCWGRTMDGQTFETPGEPLEAPHQVLTGVGAAVAAGGRQTCVVVPGPRIECVGRTGAGAPLEVAPLPGAIPTELAAGANFGCVLVGDEVTCWGTNNAEGQLSGPSSSTLQVVPLTSPLRVVAGTHTACAILAGGALHCWGDNEYGQVGVPGLAASVRVPHRVVFAP